MIIFTKHALLRMKQRKISKKQVNTTISHPNRIERLGEDTFAHYSPVKYNKSVKVILLKRGQKTIVVTTYYI